MKFDIATQAEEQILIGEGSIKNKKAKITEKNTPYIFSLLSKIYKNREGSIVREVTSNCFDAHVKLALQLQNEAEKLLLAGGDLEEVDRLLNLADEKRNQPVFVRHFRDEDAQDYIEFVDNGTGISIDLMDNVFMSYGESDKRDSDEFIGAFGLGSKSPFSYSDHFYVITRTGGIKYTYLLYETPAGPEYDILAEEETEEPSGTVIRVPFPLEDFKMWEQQLISQLRYFRNVFILGFENVSNEYVIHDFETFQLRDDIFSKNPNAALHIVIGDVYYPLDLTLLGKEDLPERYGLNVALKFQTGNLKVSPNREDLEYNEKTKSAVLKRLEEFKVEINNLILNKNHFISKTIIDYRRDIQALDKGTIVVTNLIPDQEVFLNLTELKLFKKEDVRYSFELGKFQVHIPLNQLTPYAHITALLMNGYVNGDRKLTVFNNTSYSDNKKILELYEPYNSGKYVVIPKKKLKLKLNERAFLNERLRVSRVLHFNEKDFLKQIIKNIHIFDLANNSEKRYKDLTLSELKELIIEFKKVWYEQVFAINFVRIESLNIPDDYGKVKRPSITLQDGSILTYTVNSNRTFERKEYPAKKLLDSLTDGHLKGHIIIYGEEKDRNKLFSMGNGIFRNLTKAYADYKVLDADRIIHIFYCAKKYFKLLEQMPNTYNVNAIAAEKEESAFIKHPKIKKLLLKSVKGNIINKLIEKHTPSILFQDLTTYIARKSYKDQSIFVTKFDSLLDRRNWEGLLKEQEGSIGETQIKLYLSDVYISNFQKKIENRIQSKIEKLKLWKSIVDDFFLEINYFYKFFNSSDVINERIKHFKILHNSLEMKKEKIQQYIKQIKN